MSVHAGYHHRWLRRPVSTYWWLEKPSYFAFILREASCLFVAWFVAYLLLLVYSVSESPDRYQQFLAWSATPVILTVNVVTLAFLLYHAITFFQAAPQAMVVRLGRRRVPPRLVLLGHYVAWALSSAVIVWVLLTLP